MLNVTGGDGADDMRRSRSDVRYDPTRLDGDPGVRLPAREVDWELERETSRVVLIGCGRVALADSIIHTGVTE